MKCQTSEDTSPSVSEPDNETDNSSHSYDEVGIDVPTGSDSTTTSDSQHSYDEVGIDVPTSSDSTTSTYTPYESDNDDSLDNNPNTSKKNGEQTHGYDEVGIDVPVEPQPPGTDDPEDSDSDNANRSGGSAGLGGGFWSGVGNFFSNYVVQPINNYVVQPFLNNVAKPLWNASTELAQDSFLVARNVVTWPFDAAFNFGVGMWQTGQHLWNGNYGEAWERFKHTGADLIKAPIEFATGTFLLTLHGMADFIDNSLQWGESRPLTSTEIATLRVMYPNMDLSNIQLRTGGIRGLFMRAHTIGTEIFMPTNAHFFNPDGTLTAFGHEVLSHEVAHTMQFQNGGSHYIGEAVIAQGQDELGLGPGYKLQPAFDRNLSFEDMNREQQAQLMQVIGKALNYDARNRLSYTNFTRAASSTYPPFNGVSLAQYNSIVLPVHQQMTSHVD